MTTTITYSAPIVYKDGIRKQTVTYPGEEYRGWIIDQPPDYVRVGWRIVDSKSGQVLADVESVGIARRLIDLLCETSLKIVEAEVRDGVQTYRVNGLSPEMLETLHRQAVEGEYESQVVPGPAEFDPEKTGG